MLLYYVFTLQGKIKLHDYLGSSWGLLCSHPADFTPVCTTELGTCAKLNVEGTATFCIASDVAKVLTFESHVDQHVTHNWGLSTCLNKSAQQLWYHRAARASYISLRCSSKTPRNPAQPGLLCVVDAVIVVFNRFPTTFTSEVPEGLIFSSSTSYIYFAPGVQCRRFSCPQQTTLILYFKRVLP